VSFIWLSHSGSGFPATLAFQIRELERETSRALALDAIVTVIDAENFIGYEDTSVTARMQAQYTDVLLIVGFQPVDFCMDFLIFFIVLSVVEEVSCDTPVIHPVHAFKHVEELACSLVRTP
jgi:hypothetical protein